jgi:hypothetical protein
VISVALLPVFLGCDSFGSDMCDCPSTGVTVVIAMELAATELRLSGPACQGADVLCGTQTGLVPASTENLCATENHYVHPVDEGTCRIEVDFDGRAAFVHDVVFERGEDGGLYATGGEFVIVE